jgi:syntaxin 8
MDSGALNISDSLPGLRKQYGDLTSQFHGFSSPSTADTLTHANDPSLNPDFEHATRKPAASTSSLRPKNGRTVSKTVRFSDSPSSPAENPDLEAQLFGGRYRDNPDDSMGYQDEASEMNNVQIHEYHRRILDQQDEQLDRLGASIARQRELSMQIGDELDDHVAMLDDVDVAVERHQGRLDRAKRQVNRMTRAAGESKQMIAIIVLIIVLVLLIAILK